MDLQTIRDPSFVKKLSWHELDLLAADLRHAILEGVSTHGGHLSSNLGIVELTIALHYVFDSPTDKFLFDVGHQSYTHKILTGRYAEFMSSLRQWQGLSGYQKRSESPHDVFEAGHSSTSLSAAMGMALARDLNHQTHNVIALVGDASLTSGMAMEALNHLGHFPHKVILIYNDNGMGISKPVGGISKAFTSARNSVAYQSSKKSLRLALTHAPLGRLVFRLGRNMKELTRRLFLGTNLFENMKLAYLGPFSGHRISTLVHALEIAKASDQSIVVHVVTEKGKGYSFSEHDQTGEWHGVDPFNIESGKQKVQSSIGNVSWSQAIANLVEGFMEKDEKIVTITPAMITGAKLESIFSRFPERSFDVGIAEAHAVTFSAGLSLQGKKPFLSIYSTFLQRSYDQINHDIGRMKLPVVFGVDRSGVVGKDGETHQGIFDVSFVKSIPNSIIAMPKDMEDAYHLLRLAFNEKNQATYIRYPRGKTPILTALPKPVEWHVGKWDILANVQSEIAVIVTGPMVETLQKRLAQVSIKVDIIYARYYKPIDSELLMAVAKTHRHLIVYDVYSTREGLFETIQSVLQEKQWKGTLEPFVVPTDYLPQGEVEELLKHYHLDCDALIDHITLLLNH